MSWWGIGEDDVIGDGPANALTEALVAIGTARQEQGQSEPAFQEMLDGFAEALQHDGSTALEDGPAHTVQRLVARLGSGMQVVSGETARQSDGRMVAIFRDGIAAIQRQYEERWERKPRLREMLETLGFILGARPDRFLSGMEGQSIDRIIAE